MLHLLLALSAHLTPSAQVGAAETDAAVVEVDLFPTVMSRAGELVLRFSFTPRTELASDVKLRVGLDLWDEALSTSDHALEPPPGEWQPGVRVDQDLPIALPAEATLAGGDLLGIYVGFHDAARRTTFPSDGAAVQEDGLAELAVVPVASFLREAGEAELRARIAEARALRKAGDAPGAWRTLVETLREATDDPTKEALRDELLEIGKFEPAPLSEAEQRIVQWRVDAEKSRVYRLEAGRMHDRGQWHGALRLLEAAGGRLSENADAAVAEALNEAERVQHSIDDLREELVRRRSPEQQARVDALIAEHGLTKKLRKEVERLIKDEEYVVAIELLRQLRKSDDDAVEAEAWERIPEVEALEIARTPPEEQERVEAVRDHPAWARTTHVASHEFVFIGPKKLVQGIPAPSKLHFDVAYVFITDLFGRIPNPDGDRITVYFKELWDFGGGVGGGKIINIGKADPSPSKPVRVDNGLLYHELTHCVEDVRPDFAGFSEGLANLGAAYTFEALDQDADALHSFDGNLAQFRQYFLERDLEYWLIQNYGPSAGFFLHFVDTYSKLGPARHDWAPLRQFFREYAEPPTRDGREPYVIRSIAHGLRRAFGPRVFDDLVEFGFPLEEPDRRAVSLELAAFDEDELESFEQAFEDFPDSPLPRDLLQRELVRALKRKPERAAELKRELGIIDQWMTIGPFFAKRADPGARVFEPEYHVDFERSVVTLRATRDDDTTLEWRAPTPGRDVKERPDVLILPVGWVRFDYKPYGQRNAAIYALTNVTVAEDVDALAHVRADDDLTLFVNGARVVDYAGRGSNGASRNDWRGPRPPLPDGMRVPVRLRAGRNRVLVKIENGGGTAGVGLAFSRLDGSRLELTQDSLPPDESAPPDEIRWKRVLLLDHRSFKKKARAAVGGFKAKGKAIEGTDKDGGVEWRRFTVRPGFPKDSPSNLAWLQESVTAGMRDVRVELALEPEAGGPKLVLTLQGEGGKDGLSGWNLVLLPRGGNGVVARLERYDRLVLETDSIELPEVEEERRVVFELVDGAVSVWIDETPVFERASVAPIAGRDRIGIATWGPQPRIRSMEVFERR